MEEDSLRLSCINAAINTYKDYGHDTVEILAVADAYYRFVRLYRTDILDHIKTFNNIYKSIGEINKDENSETNS